MSDLEIKSTGMTYWKRVVRGDELVAILSQLASGRWVINDANDKRMCNQTFPTTGAAKKWLAERPA